MCSFFVCLLGFFYFSHILKGGKTFQGESKTAVGVFLAFTIFQKLFKRSSSHLHMVTYLVYVI